MGTMVEEVLEGYQIVWLRFIGGIKYFQIGKVAKQLMGFKNFWNIFQAQIKTACFFRQKLQLLMLYSSCRKKLVEIIGDSPI